MKIYQYVGFFKIYYVLPLYLEAMKIVRKIQNQYFCQKIICQIMIVFQKFEEKNTTSKLEFKHVLEKSLYPKFEFKSHKIVQFPFFFLNTILNNAQKWIFPADFGEYSFYLAQFIFLVIQFSSKLKCIVSFSWRLSTETYLFCWNWLLFWCNK